jgi:hypothetical protein
MDSHLKSLTQDELRLIIIIIKNKQTLALLQREAVWLSTHVQGPCDGSVSCDSHYSGDTACEHVSSLQTLVTRLFDMTVREE